MTITTDLDRYCRDEEVQFAFETNDNIVSAKWEFINVKKGTSQTVEAFTTNYTFTERSNYRIELFVTDDQGCETRRVANQFIDRLVVPDFEGETGVCPHAPLDHYRGFPGYPGEHNRLPMGILVTEVLSKARFRSPLTEHIYDDGGKLRRDFNHFQQLFRV